MSENSNSQKQQKDLRVTEVFESLQGESNSVGLPTTFIRLTGCPLRCGYCDTSYAFSGGEWMGLDQILEQVATFNARCITVTGGEPLAQKMCLPLLSRLCDSGYQVSLETSGALDVSGVDSRVSRVIDLKTPGSGEVSKNLYENLSCLNASDQIKFVICDRDDFDWACEKIEQYKLIGRCEVLMSPVHEQLAARQLAEWILESGLQVRFQLQLHKLLWDDEPGR